ncbi:MAG: hypothetical protein QOD72_495, partial [Acidimicrobiaceae bacterium]|nr:hypothetical protein [Acidimicrobiaceae bacterium]
MDRLGRAGGPRLTDEVVARWGTALRHVGRLTLNFHPDRYTAQGVTVAEGLLDRGRYCNQFETGVSNGSRSAVRGGDRDVWEGRLFGDAYRDVDDTARRPVYGAFDLLCDPHGGSPRFGSSYVVLQPHVVDRTTLCVGDSHEGPRDVGTVDEPLSILAGLFEQAARGELLGRIMGLDVLREVISGRFSP